MIFQSVIIHYTLNLVVFGTTKNIIVGFYARGG